MFDLAIVNKHGVTVTLGLFDSSFLKNTGLQVFFLISTIMYVVGTQNNCLNEAVLLSIQNICLN